MPVTRDANALPTPPMRVKRPNVTTVTIPALANEEDSATSSYTRSARSAMTYAATPNTATPTRATATFARSDRPGRSCTTTLCDTSPDAVRSALSTVDRIAETNPPTNST
jgi:hypothetical protein